MLVVIVLDSNQHMVIIFENNFVYQDKILLRDQNYLILIMYKRYQQGECGILHRVIQESGEWDR